MKLLEGVGTLYVAVLALPSSLSEILITSMQNPFQLHAILDAEAGLGGKFLDLRCGALKMKFVLSFVIGNPVSIL